MNMLHPNRYILLSFFFFLTGICFAQPYYFRHYQVESGLSNNAVFATAQDKQGFMWFGTKDGLNRFDGYQFKTYRHDADNDGSIGNDLIYALHYDQSSRLWVGTNRGVYLYMPRTEKFRLVKGTEKLRINDIAHDRDGNLWIISLKKIYVYDPHSDTITQLKRTFDATSVSMMLDGSIWISTMQGTIEQFDPRSKKFRSTFVMNKANPKDISWVTRILDMGNGEFLIGTANQGFKRFNRSAGTTTEILTFNPDQTAIYVRDMIRTSKGEYWIATETGIYIYSAQGIVQLKNQHGDGYSLSNNAIYSLLEDSEKGIWAGTYFGGANYCTNRYAVFTKYFPQKGVNSISGNDVREICKDVKGRLWIGTEDAGLNMLDPQTGHFENFFPDGKATSISYSNIHGLLVDEDKLWIGTFEHGLDVMDLKTRKVIKHYTAGKGNSLRAGFIVSFCKTRNGDILVATIEGLYRYNRKNDDFELVDGLPVMFYQSIYEDSRGNIWVSSFNNGLFCFNPAKKGYTQYKNDPRHSGSIGHNTVNGVFEDYKGKIWVTTDGGGLNLLDADTKTFTRITVKDGLPSNFLFKIIADDDHLLWITSSRGLIRFDPVSKTLRVFSTSNGLLTDQFNYNSGFKDRNGDIYFGSVEGMISFHPEQFRDSVTQPKLKITGFQIDNQEIGIHSDSVLRESILYTNQLVLDNAQSTFSIDFAAVSFLSPDMTQYAYRMKGISDEWVHLKTNRKAYFTQLAPGKYTFEVKALGNGNHTWTKKNPILQITVLPPFYRSNLAYLSYAILLGIACWFLLRSYHLRIEDRNRKRMEQLESKKEKEIYQAKIEFFTNIAHEIRTPLTLIKGPMEDISKMASVDPYLEKKLKIMQRNTDRIFNLTNQLLDFRKTEINGYSLNFVKTDLCEILNEIYAIFLPVAEKRNISYHIFLPSEAFEAYIDTEAFYKIVSNLIDNAIKYGDSLIELKLWSPNVLSGKALITITSDGKPITADLHEKIFEPFFRATDSQIRQGTGIGLSLSKSLADLHGGSLAVSNDQSGRNVFSLELPVHQSIEFNLKGKWKKKP